MILTLRGVGRPLDDKPLVGMLVTCKHVVSIPPRGVAQLASAPGLGPGGPQFESGHPDQSFYNLEPAGIV
jgi:hypothetical protein